jgi:hypothetical protein
MNSLIVVSNFRKVVALTLEPFTAKCAFYGLDKRHFGRRIVSSYPKLTTISPTVTTTKRLTRQVKSC